MTILVRVLTAEVRSFWLMNLAVVVASLPLTVLKRVKELVVVETVRRLVVPEATRLVRSRLVDTPLTEEVMVAPETLS